MSAGDGALRDACRDNCAPDVPCFELDEREGVTWKPCDDCLVACGFPPSPPLIDPNAVVRPLL